MNRAVLPKKARSSEVKPDLTTAAPASPPSSACDEDVGSPHHQVSRSQTTAPTSPEATRPSVTTPGSTPLAMLPATCVSKRRKAMKLNAAAQMTAALGDSTRVETTVAMLLAAS